MMIIATVQAGKPIFSSAQKKLFNDEWKRLEGKEVSINVKLASSNRSMQSNRYYWGVVLTTIASETVHTIEEIHEVCKSKFLPRVYIMMGKKEQQITKSTTDLSTVEFSAYIEAIKAFAGSELGIEIPPP